MILRYSKNQPYGFFRSEAGRAGLNFPSAQEKFFFKEKMGISSESFMDMSPGYDAQMHFNEAIFPYKIGGVLNTMPPDMAIDENPSSTSAWRIT